MTRIIINIIIDDPFWIMSVLKSPLISLLLTSICFIGIFIMNSNYRPYEMIINVRHN